MDEKENTDIDESLAYEWGDPKNPEYIAYLLDTIE